MVVPGFVRVILRVVIGLSRALSIVRVAVAVCVVFTVTVRMAVTVLERNRGTFGLGELELGG